MQRSRLELSRRQWLKAASLGLVGTSASGWLPALADQVGNDPGRRRHCILLWMTGGPSQIDTFDMKPYHENGGEFKPIATNVSGVQISENLPKLATMADRLGIVRGLSTKEGDHGRGTYLMRTGHQPMGTIRYPAIGSSLSKELAADLDVPAYVSISPYRAFNQAAFSPGFLGPKYAALTVGAADAYTPGAAGANAGDEFARLKVDNLVPPDAIDQAQFDKRLDLWRTLQEGFLSQHQAAEPLAHDTVYQRAVRLMNSSAARAFDLEEEPGKVREAYGKGRFGQGCLMARRLIEQGVAFVEVSLGTFGGGSLGWDTHRNNFASVKQLSAELDAGWSTLMTELDEGGLLDSTTILWMGEFGRTPKINRAGGRDHFPAAWSAVLAGGGIQGGRVYGETSDDGMTVEEGQCDQHDLLATLCAALGVSPDQQNISEMGRPIRIAEGKPIREILS